MSRHIIPTRGPEFSCVVGYDRGMSTYFAIVTDIEIERKAEEATARVLAAETNSRTPEAEDLKLCDAEAVVLWVGAGRVAEIGTVFELAAKVSAYADIDGVMHERLRQDEREAGEPTEAQQIGQAFINLRLERDGV